MYKKPIMTEFSISHKSEDKTQEGGAQFVINDSLL